MPVAPSSLIAAVDREQLGETDADSSARLELLDRFALICDPRSRRGRRHSLASVLAVVACATVAVGSDSLTAIEQWADNAPQQVLADRVKSLSYPGGQIDLAEIEEAQKERVAELEEQVAHPGASADKVRTAAAELAKEALTLGEVRANRDLLELLTTSKRTPTVWRCV
ncbi:MAG: hypothetical protein JWM93_922 [Frankiales bacterium]|nr:hypothetical protein [Frankiales bacterium]